MSTLYCVYLRLSFHNLFIFDFYLANETNEDAPVDNTPSGKDKSKNPLV